MNGEQKSNGDSASGQTETYSSRKREREISQEPSTPSVDAVSLVANHESNGNADYSSGASPRSKRRSPKKNRVGSLELDDTKEEEFEQEEDQEECDDNEEEEDKMVTSVSGSPPHETKMRQISEGVGGIKMIKQPAGSAIAVVLDRDAIVESEDVFVDAVERQDDKLEVEPPHFVATITATDVSTSSLPEPQPLPQEAPASDEDPEFLAPLQPFPSTSSGSSDPDSSFRRDSESEDIEQEKILKRKLGDRAVSESREAENGGKKALRKAVDDVASTTATGSKRSRDEGSKDANPRETKRPSPPPEKKEESSSSKDEKPTPIDSSKASTSSSKLSGFGAYAGSSSPFASVKGPKWMSGSPTNESAKRPRDDADKDDNPRETKRPSPPPEQKAVEGQEGEASGSSSGFMAFASTSSPFAKVKGPNLFASSGKSSETSSPWSSGRASPFSSSLKEPIATRGSIDAFASSSSASADVARSTSPVAALGRSKSPPPRKTTPGVTKNSSAFSAYATSGVKGFSLPSAAVAAAGKRTRADDLVDEVKRRRNSIDSSGVKSDEEEGGSEEREKMSFGERLRAEKDDQGSGGSDDDGKVVLTEQELLTGEEDEETIYQVRGKLFALSDQNQWREKGTGIIRLNLRKSDGGGARLVMRKDAVYTVILNATLFKGMRCSYAPQDQRYLRFSTFENGTATHYNLRLANAKIAGGLLEEVNAHIPS